ncbi:MAG: hypothetical protein WBW60_18625, partial [Candidatus Sulfotelmatobacter sp.]
MNNQMSGIVTRNIFPRTAFLGWAAALLLVAGARQVGMAQAAAAPQSSSPSSAQSSVEPSSQSSP